MKRIAFLLTMIGLATQMNAQTVTWADDIAPMVFDHCTKCHRPGEIGPMPFTTYDEVAGYASIIEYVTSIKYMPPWSPEPGYGNFRDENVLTDEQIALFATWVDEGMPTGNLDNAPDAPVYAEGSQIGTPDLILTMEEAYLHEGDMTDQYQVFVLETGLEEDQDVRAIEVRQDNNLICHHAIIGQDTTDYAYQLDAEDPDYGYENFGGFGFEPLQPFLSAWVPGSNPIDYPPTIGSKLFANSKLLLQMHYGPTSVDEYDQTSINIFFSEEPIERYAITFPMSPQHLDESFVIPPNEISSFHGTIEMPTDVSLIGIAPHSHLLGKSWEVFAVSPDETDTIPLINIPEWEFNWQGFYAYENLVHIPGDYVVHAIGEYDNTSDNPYNPNDPPEWSWWGEDTEDEMYLVYFTVIPYQEGDEDISLSGPDATDLFVYPGTQLFPSYPNPTTSEFTFGFSLEESQKVNVDLVSSEGKVIETIISNANYAPGRHQSTINVSGLATGTYYYVLWFDDFRQSRPIIIR
ncbi:T9SS type A sorting domain-containing protein [Sanyastnella coralliicola]|uniref:T9SS type A sorting domain-containing protein n=1 Tax=Sanyastnella coralliicola TaxID=3069118 RepID=UPI0027B886EA|nr:T9SS type A sorting domain-containing protein [Longitalea sp. SCSIO 12813]